MTTLITRTPQPTDRVRPTLLTPWQRAATAFIFTAGILFSQLPCLAAFAPAQSNLPPTFTSGTLEVPAILLNVARQALDGPKHDLLIIDYASANSANRSALGVMKPTSRIGVQLAQTTPFANLADAGLVASPTWRLTWPVGQGEANINLGLQGLLSYTQGKPLANAAFPQASVQLNLPLLAGGDLRHSQANLELLSARASYQMQRRNLISEAISSYLALQKAEDNLYLAELSCALAQAEYERASEAKQQGAITGGELNRLRNYWQSTVDTLAAAQRTRALTSDQLQALLGATQADSPLFKTEPWGTNAALTVLQASLTPLPADLAGWIQLALTKREDMEVTRAALVQAEAAAAKARATANKQLNFTASLGWPREISASKQDLRTELQVGLQGTFYLFSTASEESVTMADLAASKAKYQLQAKELAISQEVQLAFYDVEACWRALALAQEQQAQEELLLATMRQRLNEGLAIWLDVQSQELAAATQAARVRNLQADLLRYQILLWHAAGLQIVQLSI